jgi:hypothetical protein
MEGSMASVYYSLMVPLEEAIVAVILYRLVYYVFPFLTSLLVYRSLFKESRLPENHWVDGTNLTENHRNSKMPS